MEILTIFMGIYRCYVELSQDLETPGTIFKMQGVFVYIYAQQYNAKRLCTTIQHKSTTVI